jgi:hypothetical protein|tara:strand:- start:106 stop:501 length:396 start_codon:yes stop_codon:yes gene_type:complete
MIIDLKLRPYAECDKVGNPDIEDFDEEEWDLVADMFERLVLNFRQAYPKINIKRLDTLEKPYIYIDLEKESFLEEELDYYIEILSGFDSENIIFFDDIKYIIRCHLIKKDNKKSILDKFNDLVLDIAPDLL